MMHKTMYSASFDYGQVSLIKITISKETAQTISVSEKEVIVDGGYQYFGYKRVFKDGLNLFDTLTGAIEYLIKALQESNEKHLQSVDKNNQDMYKLEALKDE